MKTYKRIGALALALLFALCLPAQAADESGPAAEEVIYARLSASGEPESAYAVVAINAAAAEEITHYGQYTEVKNLTDTAPIDYRDGRVALTASAERMYYQGTLKTLSLPWNVEISYTLDGNAVTPEALGGQSGQLSIRIRTEQNPDADASFFDNYLLQVTVTLDAALCADIDAPGASIASAGGSKSVTFTVLPGKAEEMTVSAAVHAFQMEGISLAAVPYDVADAMGDLSELTDGLTQLTDAIADLSDGAAALSEGAASLRAGTGTYGAGLSKLAGNSAELVIASEQISGALKQLDDALRGQSGTDAALDLTALSQLPASLRQLAGGLRQLSAGLTELQTGYTAAYDALSQAVAAIPAPGVTEAELAALMALAPGNTALAALAETYQAAQTVRGTWTQTQAAFAAVRENLPAFAASADTLAASLETMAQQMETALASGGVDLSGLAQLAEGLQSLSERYVQFHEGLTAYTGGVDTLAKNWSQIAGGVADLAGGARTLSEGAGTLQAETQTIPDQMEALLGDEAETFEPHSFLDARNGNTTAVQFVLTTEAIELPTAVTMPGQEESVGFFQGLWNRLVALFT